ncbi:pilus assembly protein [Massilia sp. R2A-15]|uniref:TadE family protein n=1 Tax=Massilia sp. R2A-15 TaxID=3064278 RepID=UPI0027370FE5|nr:TadE family protein [Massilia sp. R2A-15]WLI91406.1 pilus assembly protein [Massilia sp. R2A-15]
MIISPRRASRHRRQQGVAAVELAFLLPILLIFFTVPLFFSVYFWHYTAAQKAAQHAARYLSTISAQEMRSATLATAAGATASTIAQTVTSELHMGAAPATVEVYCGRVRCTGVGSRPLPDTVFVSVRLDMFDQFFGAVETGRYGWPVTAEVEMSYVGN